MDYGLPGMQKTFPSRWLFIFVFLFAASVVASEPWVTLKDCHYLPNSANDGDSFHVRTGNKDYIFRLYFVDAPETDLSIRGRIKTQVKYFHITVPQALQIGIEAERFTRQKLVSPFTVRTCLQDARGRSRLPRYYAFVQVGNTDLGESLVANGLARVFGTASEAPGMNRPGIEWQKLEQLERQARQERIGGWGVTEGRLSRRALTQPSAGADYFDSFFRPNRATAAKPSDNPTAPPVTKLDVNTATTEELQAVPGIGRVLAQRIIAVRPFASIDGLKKVKGIKERKFEQLRPYFE